MVSVVLVLLFAALVLCILDAMGKVPSWTWGFIVIVALLLQVLPRG